ncbi:MAG TPA: anthranilate phosphoribosyltransferase [Planctomycetaceae bacterium]|nr:anthranilate phosphoribosyltransferase [Planctomycetaceae bacterium]
MTTIQHALERLVSGNDLDATESYAAFGAMMDGQTSEVETAALLTALRMKGEAVPEIVGAARAMQERATHIPTRHQGLLDTCGTGGDQLHTFNISTATAFVVAACGVPVPKHGNRGVSSTSGSADVLESLGVNINLPPEKVARCLDELNLGFCFAPLFHQAMRHVGPVRKQLRFRTIFNLLGPLTNPARASFQLIGTGRKETASRLARALAELGRQHAYVVCGADQLDEVSLWGVTTAFEVTGPQVSEQHWTPETFGLPECRPEELEVDSPAASAEMLRAVFAGGRGAARNIVLANAAAALMAAVKVGKPREGMELAAAAIDSGRVRELLARLIELTQRLSRDEH